LRWVATEHFSNLPTRLASGKTSYWAFFPQEAATTWRRRWGFRWILCLRRNSCSTAKSVLLTLPGCGLPTETNGCTSGGGVGLDALAAQFARGVYRNLRGRPRYLLSMIRALVGFHALQIRASIESEEKDEWQTDAFVVGVLNTPS
jgi:hypothetical protein